MKRRTIRSTMLLTALAALVAWACRSYGYVLRDDCTVAAGLICGRSSIGACYSCYGSDRDPIRVVSLHSEIRTSWVDATHRVEVGNLWRFHGGPPR